MGYLIHGCSFPGAREHTAGGVGGVGAGSISTRSMIARLHRSCTEKVQTTKAEERGWNEYSIERRENSLSHNSILHRNWDAHTTPDDPAAVGACV